MYTLSDPITGQPDAIVYPDGTIRPAASSNVGKTIISEGVEYVVTWDGAKPDPMKGGHTKGRLLPAMDNVVYIDSLVAFFRHLMIKRPTDANETDETQTGAGKPATRTKKTNRSAGKREAKGVKQAA